MCGIAGIISWERPLPPAEVLDGMLRRMIARGPDHQGHRVVGAAALGSCRLAIQDLSPAGQQPILNETGTVAVVFNGEIYNAPALRSLLATRGHRFRSHSDTEVLVHGYEEWGLEGLQDRCDGMWAFALWDQAKRTAYLSRDRCGEKPLFYAHRQGELWFASTIDAILAPAASAPAYRPDVVLEYLACGYVPPDRCAFDGIDKLPPGCCIEVTADSLTCRRYWHLRYEAEEADLGSLEGTLEERLDHAVAQCLLADVPVGAFLSGGVDSSVIVALAARHTRRLRTFTMRVPGTERDEGHYASLVARRYDTDHVEIPLGSECVEALPELAALIGEPFADSSCIPAYFVSREIRRHATVVLGGDGGDEGFGGYGSVPYLARLESLHRSGFAAFRPLAGPALTWADTRSGFVPRGLRAAAYASGFEVYLRNLTLLGPAQAATLIGPALNEVPVAAWSRPFSEPADVPTPAHWYQRGLAAGIRTTLAGDYLVKIDSATMGHSIEARSPFLSRRVLEFAARLPPAALSNENGDKVLLKQLARKLVPGECLDRNKAGFSVPLERWIEGPWHRLAQELLTDSLAVREGLLSRRGVDLLLGRSPIFAYRRASIVFAVLMLELWLRLVARRTESVATLRHLIAQPAPAATADMVVA